MRLLYIFPHPDDESFGPGPVMRSQVRAGHRVDLLTLTRGEATRQRERLGLTLAEMGAVRERELAAAADVLGVSELTVLDLPDGKLKELDPLELESAVGEVVDRLRPDVLVTYAVHGISGHPDHLVTHAVVKRVYSARRREASSPAGSVPAGSSLSGSRGAGRSDVDGSGGDTGRAAPRRLALFTLVEEQVAEHLDLRTSEPEEVGCVVRLSEEDIEVGHAALARYETYREVIERHRPLDHVGRKVRFELFGERPASPLADLTADLPGA